MKAGKKKTNPEWVNGPYEWAGIFWNFKKQKWENVRYNRMRAIKKEFVRND